MKMWAETFRCERLCHHRGSRRRTCRAMSATDAPQADAAPSAAATDAVPDVPDAAMPSASAPAPAAPSTTATNEPATAAADTAVTATASGARAAILQDEAAATSLKVCVQGCGRHTSKYDLAQHARACGVRARKVSKVCLLYTSPSPRDKRQSRMPSSA